MRVCAHVGMFELPEVDRRAVGRAAVARGALVAPDALEVAHASGGGGRRVEDDDRVARAAHLHACIQVSWTAQVSTYQHPLPAVGKRPGPSWSTLDERLGGMTTCTIVSV